MAIEIRKVTTDQQRESVYQLRYEVYVEEMGRPQPYADHTRRRIEEPLDQTARIFAAFDENGRAVGTVRCVLP